MKKTAAFTLTVSLLSISLAGAGEGQNLAITRATVDGGGVMRSAGGTFELSATIGQPDSGVLAGGPYEVSGGFWFGLPPGDINDDGLVALSDYEQFVTCLTGPVEVSKAQACASFDLDGNGVVDMVDAADFFVRFTGS